MKKNVLIIILVLITGLFMHNSTLTAQEKPNFDVSCSDLFISELYFEKSTTDNPFDLNYAVEIYNPTDGIIYLDNNYSLSLTNNVNTTVGIPLLDSILPGEVYVVCNENSDLNLQAIADKLSADLDFEGYVMLELKKNGITLDRIGQPGSPTVDVIDYGQLIADPIAYLSTLHIDLNDFQNIDLRRGLFVNHGNPNFGDPTDLIGNWWYWINNDRSDIGVHKSICHKPTAVDFIGFYHPEHNVYSSNITDPLELNVNGNLFGMAYNWMPTLTIMKSFGPADICSTPAIPFPDLQWVNNIPNAMNSCESITFTYSGVGSTPKAQKSIYNHTDTWLALELISSDPNVIIDLATSTHRINVTQFPVGINSIMDNVNLPSVYPTTVTNQLNIESKYATLYVIYNLLGKEVAKGKNGIGQATIPLYDLSQGVYLINLSLKDGTAVSKTKFVKN